MKDQETLTGRSPIHNKWLQLGGKEGGLDAAIAQKPTSDGTGKFVDLKGGSIYWHPTVGVFEVHGAIREKWRALGSEAGFLGYPVTDQCATPDNKGRYNHFQHGSIYWSPGSGAFEVHGAIRDKWSKLSWEQGFLGYPITDECTTPDKKGRYNHFQHGSIYWHPDTGAYEVHGAIRDKWAALGWEKSSLGYPISDEMKARDKLGRVTYFQNGFIYWHQTCGTIVYRGMRVLDYTPDFGCQWSGQWSSIWGSPTGNYSSDLVIDTQPTFGAQVPAAGRYNNGTLTGAVTGTVDAVGNLAGLRFLGQWQRTSGDSGGQYQYGQYFLDLWYESGGCRFMGRWTYGNDNPLYTGWFWQGSMK